MITSTTALVMSAVIAAASAVSQGQAARSQANFQATVARQQADRERQQAAIDAEDFSRKQSGLMASRRAALGGMGVDAGSGSPLLGSEEFAGEATLQALRIRNGGEVNATRLEQTAVLQRAAGRNAATNGFVRGGALLLDGASKAYT